MAETKMVEFKMTAMTQLMQGGCHDSVKAIKDGCHDSLKAINLEFV